MNDPIENALTAYYNHEAKATTSLDVAWNDATSEQKRDALIADAHVHATLADAAATVALVRARQEATEEAPRG